METQDFSFLEVKASDDSGRFTGYAAVFNNVDKGRDVVVPGAFKSTISRMKRDGSRIPVLWQHDMKQPIGYYDAMREDEHGLFVEGALLVGDVQKASEAYAMLKSGVISGISIGFVTKKYEIDETKRVRKLTDVELYEASLVTFPMNDKARVTGVKSLPATIREYEGLLSDMGFSLRQAKALASEGFKAIAALRDAGEHGLDDAEHLRDAGGNVDVKALVAKDAVLNKFLNALKG